MHSFRASLSQGIDAVQMALARSLNVLLSVSPMAVTPMMTTSAISAASKAYSIAVAPLEFLPTRFRNLMQVIYHIRGTCEVIFVTSSGETNTCASQPTIARRIFCKVLLMIILSKIKRRCHQNFCCDFVSACIV